MAKDRYVAYVGTYTYGSSEGIHIFDIDSDTWTMKERKVVPINNPSDVLVSNNGKYLYAIADLGVNAYRILEDGDLEFLNSRWTGGIRGCYLETDPNDRFLFECGYHDGRISVMKLNEDGSLGEIADRVFHKGIGLSMTDRRSMPHVTCLKLAPDFKGLCAVDSGLDQVKVYDIDYETGKLHLNDIIRCDLDSGPKMIRIDKQRKYVYVLGEMSNRVCVYKAVPDHVKVGKDIFEPIQKISTIDEGENQQAAASGIEFSEDGKHLFVTNAGINSVMVYDVDESTGLLTRLCHIKCSGDYPKAVVVMPDNEHFVVLSHNTDEIFVYKMDYERKCYLLSAKPIKIEQPNSIYIHKLK